MSGKIPEHLEGTLYRNTSALFERKNELPGHLFDGVILFLIYLRMEQFLKWHFLDMTDQLAHTDLCKHKVLRKKRLKMVIFITNLT